MNILSRYKRRILLDTARTQLTEAADAFAHVLLSADTEYATQDAEWQEGPDGARHCAASEKLRQTVLILRGLDLPGAEELG